MMRDEARRFLKDRCPPKVVRRALDGAIVYDADLWKEIAALGWIGVGIPEAFGGSGIGTEALCVLAGEMGEGLTPGPVSSSAYLAVEAILLAGDDAQKRELLPKIASGESIATVALAEGPGNPAPRAINTTYTKGTITGTKWPVPDGGIADQAIVIAKDASGEIGFYAVALNGDGVERDTLKTIDPTRNYATLV